MCTVAEQMAYEVEWYEKYGKYPSRITTDELGRKCVVPDRAWNRRNPYRQETIRQKLLDWVQFRVTGIKA